jgi:hypothetical protein
MEHLPLLTSSAASRKKVFGLGPPRTGTDSLRVALTHLGFGPTYHMREVLFEDAGIPTGDDMEKWRQAGLGNDVHKNLAEILEPWNLAVIFLSWPFQMSYWNCTQMQSSF